MKNMSEFTSEPILLDKNTNVPAIDVFRSFFHTAQAFHLPIAAWQLPFKKEQHVILDLSGEAKTVIPELETLPPGFVFHPFQTNSLASDTNLQALFLNADIHYSTQDDAGISTSIHPATRLSVDSVTHSVFQNLEKTAATYGPKFHWVEKGELSDTTEEDFTAMVRCAITEIEKETFHKVVPARQKIISLPASFDAVRTFFQLCETYSQAFISLISIPGVGTWAGASPEMLISTFPRENGGKIFKTVALAGTQPIQPNDKLTDAAWRQKEIEEQALVSRYIVNCFKKIRLREYEETGPKTVAAGNLMHLKTVYTVDMDAVNFPDLGSVMLNLLHPTSAVCGMPKAPALNFLLKHEGFDRSFFSGFLGPVNLQEETHIYVNLRCMQLFKDQAALYAGAGVTADSDPQREWQETEIKLNTLLNVIV